MSHVEVIDVSPAPKEEEVSDVWPKLRVLQSDPWQLAVFFSETLHVDGIDGLVPLVVYHARLLGWYSHSGSPGRRVLLGVRSYVSA